MILKIYDDIISDHDKDMQYWLYGTEGVCFADIDDFVSKIPADDPNIDILIHCRGGLVTEGWAIVDKLRSTGKKITATVDGMCASMAVSILLAASERRAQPHATLHIHKPMYPPYTLADSYNEDDLKRLAKDLEIETSRMLDWYVERTGADRALLESIMIEDRDMAMEEAISLGFIQTLVEPISASTRKRQWNKQTSNQNAMAQKNDKAGVISALASLLGLKVNVEEESAVNYVLKTQDGSELTIDKPEGEDIAVGDSASPDGEFVLEDGRTVVVADGVITEIREAEVEPTTDPEKEELEKKVEDLEARVAELEAEKADAIANAVTADQKAILDKVEKAGGMDWLKTVAKSNYTPSQRPSKSNGTEKLSKTAQRVAELREKNK